MSVTILFCLILILTMGILILNKSVKPSQRKADFLHHKYLKVFTKKNLIYVLISIFITLSVKWFFVYLYKEISYISLLNLSFIPFLLSACKKLIKIFIENFYSEDIMYMGDYSKKKSIIY